MGRATVSGVDITKLKPAMELYGAPQHTEVGPSSKAIGVNAGFGGIVGGYGLVTDGTVTRRYWQGGIGTPGFSPSYSVSSGNVTEGSDVTLDLCIFVCASVNYQGLRAAGFGMPGASITYTRIY